MDAKKQAIRALAQEAALLTQEETLEVSKKHERLIIGIPRETSFRRPWLCSWPTAMKW